MLYRSAIEDLRAWKHEARSKALLVDGARQTGKTFLLEEFAKKEYEHLAKVDFLEDESARSLQGARSARQAFELLSLISGKPIEPGKTLVFLDEIQEAPEIVTLSKYLIQDGRTDLVMSGSLLGIELSRVKSLPVGYLRTLDMAPLTFSEFCMSQNVPDSVVAQVAECYAERRPVDAAVHERLVRLLRLYLVVGGMPEAVQHYIDARGDLSSVRLEQQQLVELYREDIAKHAGDRSLQVKAIYDALPSQLAKENKRFQMQSLAKQGRYERYANDFAWLVGAHAALKANNVTDPKPMLARTEEHSRFKLYASDTGMLMSQYPASTSLAALSGDRSVNFGAVYENYVAQELRAMGCPLRYYHNSRKGEVDFLVETEKGTVLPLEVKSGKDYKRHVALNNLLKPGGYGIEEAFVLSEANVSSERREGGVVHYLPLYMLQFLKEDIGGMAQGETVVLPPEW